MKKKPSKNIIYVLTNNKEDKIYTGNEVIAVGTKELLEQYRQQLLGNGYEDIYSIEERENDGWSSGIRFSNYNLVEHNGLLYPIRNINSAKDVVNKQLSNLKMIYDGLTEMKETFDSEEQHYCETVLKIIEDKFNQTKEQKIDVKMV